MKWSNKYDFDVDSTRKEMEDETKEVINKGNKTMNV